GETQVLSIALYEQVEALEYNSAHNLALALLIFSFVMLAALYRFNGVTRSDEAR
ncbi:MAG: molybdate ABC transporter permease subunit, partial [Alteromonas sp.]